ncbi:energy transducer TonB [Erythrobacter sp. sf7]|uniref:Energy transducer TonB n=1 Tax=Erythrobacter fulvus TaxID=2987523 RepID=A0ABT5JKA7_9SPHN|nr:energy transducer TonB [Erythrobacter fulvus]MDC8753107.1 energy transducer TonB [Erythrobacter fulvus]
MASAQVVADEARDRIPPRAIPTRADPDRYSSKSKQRDPVPIWNDGEWITDADIPASSWIAGHVGETFYQLRITADGEIAECTIEAASGHSALDGLVCPLLKERAQFKPALDAEGVAEAGVYQSKVEWRKREPEFAADAVVRTRYELDERGRIQNCTVLEISEHVPTEMRRNIHKNPCRMSSRYEGIPYRDETGKPVRKAVTLTYRMEVDPVE